MPLPDEQPLSNESIDSVEKKVADTLAVVRQYLAHLRSTAVHPTLFLNLPIYHDCLQNLIDNYYDLQDLLPGELFLLRLNEMLDCRDQLLDMEKTAGTAVNLPSLFTLDLESSARGCPRLSIPREFVEELFDEAGMTNREVADLLGEIHICSYSRLGTV